MSFLRFFAIILFCIGCFFAGRFFYAPIEKIDTVQVDVTSNTQATTPPNVVPGIAPQTPDSPSSPVVLPIPPIMTGVVSSEAAKVVSIPPGARLGNQEGWNIFIKDIRVSFDEKKRVVIGSYTLENFDEKSLDSLYIQMVLMIPRKQEGYPPLYFDAQMTEKFSIAGKSEQKKEFSYPVRDGIAGENAQILLEAHMGSGDMITFIHSPKMTITGKAQIIAVKSPKLIDSQKKEYLLGDGPTIYGDREPKNLTFSYSLVNENKTSVTVTPTLEVHLFSESGPVVATEKGNTLTLKPGQSPVLSFALPTLAYTPGIYLGKLLLIDTGGVHIGLDVPLRWIVGGDVARIINVVSQSDRTQKGKNIVGEIEYTGTPPDINPAQNIETGGDEGSVLLQLEEENGTPLSAPLEKKIALHTGQKTQKLDFSIMSTESSSDAFLRVIIRNPSGTLDEKVFSLKNSFFIVDPKSTEKKLQGAQDTTEDSNRIIFLLLAILCIILSFVTRKFLPKKEIFIFFFCCLVFSLYSPRAEAYVSGCEIAGINISGPSASNTFMCGQTYTFTGGWWMNACANTDAAMYVEGNLVDYNWGINCVKPPCEYLIPRSGAFAVNKTMPANYNGYYQVHIPWSKSQGDCSNSGTAVYGVNITCPIPGACGSIHGTNQLWPTSGSWCGAGPMSGWTQIGDVSNGNIWRWNCLGQYGGADIACYFVHQCPTGFVLDHGTCRLARCNDTSSIDLSNTAPVTLAELPATLPYTFTKDYTKSLVTNGTDTAEKCEYTCVNGYRADLATNPKQCVPISCTGNVATNGTKCADDELSLSGHLDITRVRRANQAGCTAPQKCEWYCPADKPVYCATKNECVANADDCGCDRGEKMCGCGQCIAGNLACPATCSSQCNNDGVCSDNESCDCADCTNGDADDINNCKAKDGLRCTRDDTQPACTEGACCPSGTAWNCASNSCENQCGVHVPSELKAGIDIPYITCDAQPGTTHFRYEITKVSGPSISAASTSTNANFKVQKLLAKAVGGVCPTDTSAYVPNLTGIVTNDEVCVRLAYNNATTGAVSNALITDSLPTGFTRVTNSTKNCLTPTGSSELCSDAADMGGAIGNNGWSGNNFSLTPHAGFYAIPTNQTTGDSMWMGKKRYIYSQQCAGSGGIGGESFVYGFGNETSRPFNGCSYSAVAASIPSDIVGLKNYSWIACNPQSGQEGEVLIPGFTNDSSKTYPNSVCLYTSIFQNFIYSMAERYAHWLKCTPVAGQEGEEFIHGFTSSPNDSVVIGSSYPNCGLSSVAQKGTYDTLDTTNGKGYIQYKIKALSVPANTLLPNVTLSGIVTGATAPDISTSNSTINASVNSATSGLTYTSNLFVNGTSVKHVGPLVNPGTYSVKCLYGSATSAANSMAPSACTKTITVKDQSDTTVQGCSRIYAYKGNTLSDEMTNTSAFDASFRCGSRQDTGVSILPYKLMNGTQVAFLGADPFNILGLGFVSLPTQNYTFNTAAEVTCAVKVGDGYSTNESCRIRACVGTDCATPETFIITPSSNAICSKELTFTYDIGCNERSPDYAKCVAWMYRNSGTSASPVYPTIKTRENGVEKSQSLQCITSTPPGALGPVTTCTIILPTGGLPVTVFSGDTNSFQTTLYSLTRDTIAPTGSIAYYTTNNTALAPSQYQLWQKQPVTAVITCTDQPGKSDGSNCACASTLLETSGQQYWSPGVPSVNPKEGADVMKYARIFMNNATGPASVTVRDTAGNATALPVTNIGIDSVPPKVSISSPSVDKILLTATDSTVGGSGLWKPGSQRALPSLTPALQKNPAAPGILYRVFSRSAYEANPTNYEFDDNCLLPVVDNGDYFAYGQAGASMSQSLTNLSAPGVTDSFSTTTNMIAYCVQDNAGNVTRGVYPSDPVGCFSATNMSTIPTLSTYKNLTLSRLSLSLPETQKYGYSLSENAQNASCFSGLLSANINTLITSQYAPDTAAFSWNNPAYIKGISPLQKNGQGYYYYRDVNTLPVSPSATTLGSLLVLPGSPPGTGQKAILAEGKNIQINADINYTGSDKLLVIIARKNAKGGGGNILIDPAVSHIDAILIADGALMNATNGVLKNAANHSSELSNRLTINGRLYSFNTRAGSFSATDLASLPPSTTTGRYFSGSTLSTDGNLTESAQVDLERFRIILNDGNPICTLDIHYQVFSGTALPPVLQRPSGYSGGTCSF